jgi:hypothetical protein
MRCMACGAEMIVMNTVQDDTMAVPGFEHHTFMCSACHDVERRLVFTRDMTPSSPEAVPAHAAPPVAPAAAIQNERTAPAGLVKRVFARLRGG